MKTVSMTLAPLALGAALLLAVRAQAADILTDAAPPAPRVENPAPRAGQVWAPGHWEWTGHFYRWISGSYITERRHAHWVADHWDAVGSRYRYVAGHWEPGVESQRVASQDSAHDTASSAPATASAPASAADTTAEAPAGTSVAP